MRTLTLLMAGLLLSAATWASTLTWNDLIARPELRPAQCTLKKAFRFQGGLSAAAGQQMKIVEFKPGEILLESLDGRLVFATGPQDTDVVEVANAAYAALTPRQRELTVAEVAKTPALWPYTVTLKASFDVGNQRLRQGDSVYLMDIKNGKLVVVPASFSMNFTLQPEDTDLMEKARQYVETPYQGRLVEELQGKLVNPQTGQAVTLDPEKLPRYFLLYSSARWCPYCQKFTPGFLKNYRELKAKYPDAFEVIYLPSEKSAGELQTYAKELNFPWPAVSFTQKNRIGVIAWLKGKHSIPDLKVVDRHGALVVGGPSMNNDQVLAQFRTLVARQP